MAWEKRKGGWYYYRSRRVGRRVVKEYVGGGIVGQAVAELDDAERQERMAERQAQDAELERLLVDPIAELSGQVDGLVTEALEAAGFHRHRGAWRRARK